MTQSRLRGLGALLLAVMLATPALAHEPQRLSADAYPKGELPPAYAVSGKSIAYFNTPNRHAVMIDKTAPTVVGKVSLDLESDADVLVQFTSGLAAETGEGCPCSVRASLKVDDQPLVIVKRVNVGAPTVQSLDKYEHDRQSADGSYVFALTKGRHELALVIHQVDGTSAGLEAYYVNLQAIPFERR